MKIICVGRNYAEHAKELQNAIPDKPVIFMKPQTALLKDGKPFYLPEFSNQMHYETELVVRIDKNGKHIEEQFAHKYYSNATVGIDFTARDVQDALKAKGHPWELAKAFDHSAVIGDFIQINPKSVQDLHFSLSINKHIVQKGHTVDMLFSVDKVIAFVSKFITLQQGDLLFTGTPFGVGAVQIGDKLEGKLGEQSLLHCEVK